MRRLILLGVVAACGSDDGAVLTLRAPNGPGSAARIEIVLASADAAAIATADQRAQLEGLTEAPVRYYRQRAPGGNVDAVARHAASAESIKPTSDGGADEKFVPCVVAPALIDRLLAIGSVT